MPLSFGHLRPRPWICGLMGPDKALYKPYQHSKCSSMALVYGFCVMGGLWSWLRHFFGVSDHHLCRAWGFQRRLAAISIVNGHISMRGVRAPWNYHGRELHGRLDDLFPLQAGGFYFHFREWMAWPERNTIFRMPNTGFSRSMITPLECHIQLVLEAAYG